MMSIKFRRYSFQGYLLQIHKDGIIQFLIRYGRRNLLNSRQNHNLYIEGFSIQDLFKMKIAFIFTWIGNVFLSRMSSKDTQRKKFNR